MHLQACLNFVQRTVSPRFRNSTWAREVRGVIGELEKLNRTTEAGFLSVGGNLMVFLTASRQLHSDIGGLTDLVSGEQAEQACSALVSVRRYVQETQQRSEDDARALADLQAAAGRIHSRFSTLGKIALSFHITAILARIETAHLARYREDLGNLADEVRSCSDAILSRANQVLEAVAALDSRIAFTLCEVSRLEATRRKELPCLLAAVEKDLEIFSARQKLAVNESSKLAADLNSVTKDLGAIATSIQFHDITRQQVEHVIEALAGLLRTTPQRALSSSGASLVQVQSAQLKSAAAAFGQSTQKIDSDLEAIAVRVEEMLSVSESILGLGHDEKTSFLSDMQHRFTAVLRTIGESQSLEHSTRTVIADLDGLSQRLRSSVTEVQAIEIQLSRISINAAISASHVGSPGDPLNVVAGAVQALQVECASRSRDAETDLDSIGEIIGCLASGDARDADTTSDATLTGELSTRMDNLRAASDSSAIAASAVAALAESLCKNLQEAREHAGIGDIFAETVTRSCDLLDAIAAQVQPSGCFHPTVIEDASQERYTMHTERDIHQAIANGMTALPLAAASPPAGEEVEFF